MMSWMHRPLQTVIPAKAGIHCVAAASVSRVDPGLRRDDGVRAMVQLLGAICLAAAAALFVKPVQAQDRADIDRTQIIGNRELPKVLYIVPWKKPMPGELSGRPVQSVLDEALAPVDRDVFRRQVQYGDLVNAKPAEAKPAAAPAK